MPQGGVRVTVNFKPTEAHGISLEIKDQDGNLLKGQGYVAVQYGGNSFTDISTDLGKVPYGSAVTVSLTDVGKSLYSLTKVTVDGITCYDNGSYYGFYMPNKDAVIKVTLTEKTSVPTSFDIYSSSDFSKGTVGFYVGGNPVTSAQKGVNVDITFTPAAGYMLDSYTIVRNTDNVTVKEENALAKDTYTVTIPMEEDNITVTANFVNKVFKAKIKLVGADGTTVITDPNLVQIKGTDGKYKAVKHDSEVEVVFDNNVNIGLTSTGNGYKITKYTITDASTSKVKTSTECNCSDFNFKVAKEGVSEIEIRLEVK